MRAHFVSLAAAVLVIGVAACGGGAGLGESCDSQSDCADSLQCLDGVCVPRCTRNPDCGDGHACDRGVCVESTKEAGQDCDSEYECGPGLSCQLFDEDLDNNGELTASCQPEAPGGVLDDACTDDDNCRTGTCALGRCVDVCADNIDCPESHLCVEIPREIEGDVEDDYANFRGCLPAAGNITYSIPISAAYSHFLLPVPENARSFALIAEIDAPDQLVGAARIYRPGEALEPLYRLPETREDYFLNQVRSDITPGAWTLVMPQSPQVPLEPGADAYAIELGSWIDHDTPGTEVPRVQAIYRLDDAADVLDLHFYFLDLGHHPCPVDPALAGAPLSAATAQISPLFQDVFLHQLFLAFAAAGIEVKTLSATYEDILDRQDLDGLDVAKLGDLLSLSTHDGGISVFIVRTIFPSGIQAVSGGPPVPPGVAGTRASGVAVALDTLCYRDWNLVARSTAHEIARALGLHRSVEPDGYTDPIGDSDFDSNNLMYFSESGGTDLSPGQEAILRKSPALR